MSNYSEMSYKEFEKLIDDAEEHQEERKKYAEKIFTRYNIESYEIPLLFSRKEVLNET